jgi:hypothetical protein
MVDIKVEKAMKIPCSRRIYGTGSFSGHDCGREALWVEERITTDKVGLSNVLCNVHKSARSRSRYSSYQFRPLVNADFAVLNKLIAAKREEERAQAEKNRIERDKRDRENRAKAWDELDKEPTVTVEEQRFYSADHDKEWEYKVGVENKWGYGINFDLRKESAGYPYGIRLRSTGSMTPKEALLLSKTLQEAAIKAELLNEGYKDEP